MDDNPISYEQALLKTLARVRGLRPEWAVKYPKLNHVSALEATRKRFDRLLTKGLLAKSNLPAGPQIFRLSRKGARLVGAPASFADSPTQAVAYDMVAASCCAWRTSEFVFLTREELVRICQQLAPAFKMERFPGRFLLRANKATSDNPDRSKKEARLDFWLAEFKPAEQLANRIKVIVEHLTTSNPFFAEAMSLRLFGVTVAVPSSGVKAALEQKELPVAISIIVVDELSTTFIRNV